MRLFIITANDDDWNIDVMIFWTRGKEVSQRKPLSSLHNKSHISHKIFNSVQFGDSFVL
jgi:hypothetical protein